MRHAKKKHIRLRAVSSSSLILISPKIPYGWHAAGIANRPVVRYSTGTLVREVKSNKWVQCDVNVD